MKLSQIIIENVELDFTGLPEEFKERLLTYPSHYQEWGIREFKKGEHAESTLDAINYYIEKVKDNRYKEILKKVTPEPKNILTLTLKQVEDAQQEFERAYAKQSKREIRRQLVKGYTTTLVDKPGLKIIKVEKKDETDGAAKIAADLVGGARWCVVNVETGDDYLKRGPLYFIYLGDDRYLCHLPSEQLMNVNDKPFRISEKVYNLLVPYIPDVGIFIDKRKRRIYKNAIMKYPRLAHEYARDVLKRRWPEAEQIIMKEPSHAFRYAREVIKGRWPEAEPYIMKDPDYAYHYAIEVIKGRWPEAEPYIIKEPKYAYYYVNGVINNPRSRGVSRLLQRWPEAEPAIMKDPNYAYEYAENIIKGRWPEAEQYIMKDPISAYKYAYNIIKNMGYADRWPEAEPYIMESPGLANRYARVIIKGRWPEAEPIIMKQPLIAREYAEHVIKGRWPEAEPIIARNPWHAYKYADDVIKDRWPEAEPYIMNESETAYYYASDVLKRRWPEAEPTIMKDPQFAYYYASNVLKRRWPEAEPTIRKNKYFWEEYKKEFREGL